MLTLHQLWSPCQKWPEHHMSIKRPMTCLNTKTSSSPNILIKHTAGFQGSGFFQKPSSVFFSLQFAMWWLWFLRGRKKSSYSAAQKHLPPATSQTFCYDVNDVSVGYSFKATCIQYIWTANTSCILEHKWKHTSRTKGTVGHRLALYNPDEGFFLFGSVIKSNYFLLLLMLLLETLQ